MSLPLNWTSSRPKPSLLTPKQNLATCPQVENEEHTDPPGEPSSPFQNPPYPHHHRTRTPPLLFAAVLQLTAARQSELSSKDTVVIVFFLLGRGVLFLKLELALFYIDIE